MGLYECLALWNYFQMNNVCFRPLIVLRRNPLFFVTLCAVLCSCGGGGGGGSDGPVTAVDNRDEATLENAAETVLYATSIAEGVIELAPAPVAPNSSTMMPTSGSPPVIIC